MSEVRNLAQMPGSEPQGDECQERRTEPVEEHSCLELLGASSATPKVKGVQALDPSCPSLNPSSIV